MPVAERLKKRDELKIYIPHLCDQTRIVAQFPMKKEVGRTKIFLNQVDYSTD